MVQVHVVQCSEKKAEFHEDEKNRLQQLSHLPFDFLLHLAHGGDVEEHAVAAFLDGEG